MRQFQGLQTYHLSKHENRQETNSDWSFEGQSGQQWKFKILPLEIDFYKILV